MYRIKACGFGIRGFLVFAFAFLVSSLARAQSTCAVEPLSTSNAVSDGGYSYLIPLFSGALADTDFREGLGELAEWVASQTADDRVAQARAELEKRGLVA